MVSPFLSHFPVDEHGYEEDIQQLSSLITTVPKGRSWEWERICQSYHMALLLIIYLNGFIFIPKVQNVHYGSQAGHNLHLFIFLDFPFSTSFLNLNFPVKWNFLWFLFFLNQQSPFHFCPLVCLFHSMPPILSFTLGTPGCSSGHNSGVTSSKRQSLDH